MTRLVVYRCDRCLDKFHLAEDEEPYTLTLNDRVLHLCPECHGRLEFWLNRKYGFRLDEYLEKLCEEEEAGE